MPEILIKPVALLPESVRVAHCFWPAGWTERELAAGGCQVMAGQRCRKQVLISGLSHDLWVTCDTILAGRGEKPLSTDEIAVCREHLPLWRVWRRAQAELDWERDRAAQVVAAYEDLCARKEAPPPRNGFFSPATLQKYETRILNAYRRQGISNKAGDL